jgi:hypothetical protein
MAGLDRKRATTLIAVVALAVGLGLVAASGHVGRRDVDAAAMSTRSIAALAGVGIGAIVVLGGIVVARRSGVQVDRSTVAVLLLAGSVIGGAAAVDRTNLHRPTSEVAVDERPASADGQQTPGGAGARPASADDDATGLPFDVDVEGTIILLVALGLLITAIVFFGRRTELRTVAHGGVYLTSDLGPEPEPETETDDDTDRQLGDALLASLRALDASGSPAERIRAAYGTMLGHFDEIGLGRHPAEPPGAYVGRCLRSRALPRREVELLLRLFERARFSDHVLDDADVGVARDALQATVDALVPTQGATQGFTHGSIRS